jgi:hypothetical protein
VDRNKFQGLWVGAWCVLEWEAWQSSRVTGVGAAICDARTRMDARLMDPGAD